MSRLQLDTVQMRHLFDALFNLNCIVSEDEFLSFIRHDLRKVLHHESAVCGVGNIRLNHAQVRHMTNADVPASYLQYVVGADSTVHSPIMKNWLSTSRPVIFASSQYESQEDSDWLVQFMAHRFENVVAYGLIGSADHRMVYSCFYDLPEPFLAQVCHILTILMPSLQQCAQRLRFEENSPTDALGALTAREREIHRWVAQGKTNWEIGVILGISELTVKTHVQRILAKLHLSNRMQIIIGEYR